MKYLESLKLESQKNHIPIIKDEGCDFLIDFCKKHNPKNILEIGTAVGYSGSKMLLTSNDAKLTTIEIDENRFNKAKQTFNQLNLNSRVTQLLGDAKEIIQNLNTKFDLIFLDGPKGQYLSYYKSLKKLLNSGGYIIADNIYFHGLVNGPEFVKHKLRSMIINLRKFIQTIKSDDEVETHILDIADGVAIIQKK